MASGLPLVQSGQLRALGVTTAARVQSAPQVPTIAEPGVPGYDMSSWFAFFVPAKTPPEIIRKMHADTVAALAEPAIKAKLDSLGLIPVGSTPEALGTHFKAEMEKWAPVIKAAAHQGRAVISRRDAIKLTAAAALAPGLIGRAAAQGTPARGWPNRFVRLVVPFPPGGGTDAIARVVAGKLSEMWGHQMVVENRGGGGANIGMEAVARAEPDGYTMLLASLPLAVNRHLFPSLGYDPVADLAPVSLICDYPNVMTVSINSPAHSVMEFIAYAKANKGKVTFASSGHGTSVHLSGELFKRMAGIEMLHVPYRGGGPALNDLMPGRVDVMFNNIGSVLPLIQGGKLRGLGVTTAKRAPAAPQLPPIAESGVPGFDVSSWYAFYAPAKTPPEIIRKMHADTIAAITDPHDQIEAGAATRRSGRRLDAGRACSLPQVGDGEMGIGDQGSRDHHPRMNRR